MIHRAQSLKPSQTLSRQKIVQKKLFLGIGSGQFLNILRDRSIDALGLMKDKKHWEATINNTFSNKCKTQQIQTQIGCLMSLSNNQHKDRSLLDNKSDIFQKSQRLERQVLVSPLLAHDIGHRYRTPNCQNAQEKDKSQTYQEMPTEFQTLMTIQSQENCSPLKKSPKYTGKWQGVDFYKNIRTSIKQQSSDENPFNKYQNGAIFSRTSCSLLKKSTSGQKCESKYPCRITTININMAQPQLSSSTPNKSQRFTRNFSSRMFQRKIEDSDKRHKESSKLPFQGPRKNTIPYAYYEQQRKSQYELQLLGSQSSIEKRDKRKVRTEYEKREKCLRQRIIFETDATKVSGLEQQKGIRLFFFQGKNQRSLAKREINVMKIRNPSQRSRKGKLVTNFV